MPPRQIKKWDVYYEYIHYITPPHHKYLVVVHADKLNCLVFFINSEIHPFNHIHPRLLPCFAEILATENRYLKYDSWVNCKEIQSFSPADLRTHKGHVSANTKKTILAAVECCPVLAPRYKMLILR